MNVNKATIDLIKEFEGFRASTYRCSGDKLTIGYGTTAEADVGIDPQLGMTISESDAVEYLHRALDKFAASIRPRITKPINDNEFGAFMSLAYNIGPGAFAKSSALRKFNAGDKAGAAKAILLWNKAGGKVLKGLERRRAREAALFLTPVASKSVVVSGAPISVVKPAPQKPIAPPVAPPTPAKPRGRLAALFAALLAMFRR